MAKETNARSEREQKLIDEFKEMGGKEAENFAKVFLEADNDLRLCTLTLLALQSVLHFDDSDRAIVLLTLRILTKKDPETAQMLMMAICMSFKAKLEKEHEQKNEQKNDNE